MINNNSIKVTDYETMDFDWYGCSFRYDYTGTNKLPEKFPYQDTSLTAEERADDLLKD